MAAKKIQLQKGISRIFMLNFLVFREVNNSINKTSVALDLYQQLGEKNWASVIVR